MSIDTTAHIRPTNGWQENGDYISRVHFHHSVVALSTMSKADRVRMPSAVPKHVAKSIGNLPSVSYTNTDTVPGCNNGNYFPVPNCPLDIATTRLHGMQAITSTIHAPPMSATSITMAELSPEIPGRSDRHMKAANLLVAKDPTAAAVGNCLLSKTNDALLLQIQALKAERQGLRDSLKLCMDRLEIETSGLSAFGFRLKI